MAKPAQHLPGNSGHMHVSLVSAEGANLFARSSTDADAPYPDIANLSDLGRHFLAGLLAGLPDVMPILAPTINSYKRLVEEYWAPVTVSWGLENRGASIRLVVPPPPASPAAARFEVRVPGADANPALVLAAILGLGLRGVQLALPIPVRAMADAGPSAFEPLPRDLDAATRRMMAPGSVARQVLGDDFVDHFGGTRLHECREWSDAVTDWELRRYMETV
jgi:glutamine synthetase